MPDINYFWDELEDNVVREYDVANNTPSTYTTEPKLYGSFRGTPQDAQFFIEVRLDNVGNLTASCTNGKPVTSKGSITRQLSVDEARKCFDLMVLTIRNFPLKDGGSEDGTSFAFALDKGQWRIHASKDRLRRATHFSDEFQVLANLLSGYVSSDISSRL